MEDHLIELDKQKNPEHYSYGPFYKIQYRKFRGKQLYELSLEEIEARIAWFECNDMKKGDVDIYEKMVDYVDNYELYQEALCEDL